MTIPALEILKAAPQHAEELGASGLAMLLAIAAHWDSLGCSRAVCWSNSRLAERCGLSRNSIAKTRQKLIDCGWLCYLPDGRKAGHYTPKLPEWYAQSSAVECANGAQLSVQTVCKRCADECANTVQMRVTYIPIPNPIPNPDPEPADHPPGPEGQEPLFDSETGQPTGAIPGQTPRQPPPFAGWEEIVALGIEVYRDDRPIADRIWSQHGRERCTECAGQLTGKRTIAALAAKLNEPEEYFE